jgi:O-antigen/teichoic acid export membrane protein
MAQMQNDRAQLKATYLSMLRMVSSINFPIYIMIALFSKELIGLLYGPQWEQASYYLEILAIWGLIRSIGNPVGSLVIAVGRARLAFWWNIALLVVTPLVFLVSTKFAGLDGLVWSLLVLHVLIFVAMWRLMVYPLCGARFREYLGELYPPLLIAVISGTAAWFAARVLEYPLLRLATGSVVFSFCYLLLSHQFNRSWLYAMRNLLTSR